MAPFFKVSLALGFSDILLTKGATQEVGILSLPAIRQAFVRALYQYQFASLTSHVPLYSEVYVHCRGLATQAPSIPGVGAGAVAEATSAARHTTSARLMLLDLLHEALTNEVLHVYSSKRMLTSLFKVHLLRHGVVVCWGEILRAIRSEFSRPCESPTDPVSVMISPHSCRTRTSTMSSLGGVRFESTSTPTSSV